MTKRDIEILKFINEFGFCEMPQIERQFSLRKPRSYQVIKRLINAGLVVHEFVLRNRHGVYRLTRRGAQYTGLPPIRDVVLGSYLHQIKVIEVCQILMKQYPEVILISERRLKQEKYSNGRLDNRGHIADGMLLLPNDKKIAIEVEITMKGKNRLDKIIRAYALDFSVHEVWYFCSEKIINGMKSKAQLRSYMKIFELEKFLSEKNFSIQALT